MSTDKKKIEVNPELEKSLLEMSRKMTAINPELTKGMIADIERMSDIYKKIADIGQLESVSKSMIAVTKVMDLYDSSSFISFRRFMSDFQEQAKRMNDIIKDLNLDTRLAALPAPEYLDTKPHTVVFNRQGTITKEELSDAISELKIELRGIITENIQAIETKKIEASKKPWQKSLFLTESGDLYLGDNCYKLKIEGNRIKIIYKLIEAEGYIKTKTLREQTGYKTEGSLRDAIKEINSKAKYRLKIKDNLIEGRAESGYRINENYFIVAR